MCDAHVHVHLYIHVCRCTQPCVCAWRSGRCRESPSSLPTLYVETGSPREPAAHWRCQWASRLPFCRTSAGVTCTPPCLAFHGGAEDSNAGPHARIASTSHSEPSQSFLPGVQHWDVEKQCCWAHVSIVFSALFRDSPRSEVVRIKGIFYFEAHWYRLDPELHITQNSLWYFTLGWLWRRRRRLPWSQKE